MAPLIVSSPSFAAAMLLLDRLQGLFDVGLISTLDGGWELRVKVDGTPSDVLPLALSAATEWVEECGLGSVTVSLDGQRHLLQGSAVSEHAP
jgi:hypothetical protein